MKSARFSTRGLKLQGVRMMVGMVAGCLGLAVWLQGREFRMALEPCLPAIAQRWALALSDEDAVEMGPRNTQLFCGEGGAGKADVATFGLMWGCGGLDHPSESGFEIVD